MNRQLIPALMATTLAVPASAHSPFTADGQAAVATWSGVIVLLALWFMFLVGARTCALPLRRTWSFHLGCLLCALAAFGPLDHWAEHSAAAHMVQHMLFMVVIAPLWVWGQPMPALVAVGGKPLLAVWQPFLFIARRPMWSAYLHAAVIWGWHTPVLYNLALLDPWWHAVEHACFLITAVLFWWSLLHNSRRETPVALVALLFTLVHTGVLGALLTFSTQPFYSQVQTLEDQQLAGLLMWVMGGLPYFGAAGWVGYQWLRRMR